MKESEQPSDRSAIFSSEGHISGKSVSERRQEARAREYFLTIKNWVSEAPERAVHVKYGFTERLAAREVNFRLGLLTGVMKHWIERWIRVLEAGEGGKVHGHYVVRLHRFAVEWGIDYTMKTIYLNRISCGLGRCFAEWVRDAEGLARYLSETWSSGESRLLGGRAFQCSRGVKRFRNLWRNAEWLAGMEQFLLLHGCRDKEEALLKLGPLWAFTNAYTIGRLGREALAAKKMNL